MNRASVFARGFAAAVAAAGAVAIYLTGGGFWLIAVLLAASAYLIYSIMGLNFRHPHR